jgi:hypothetical protein
MGHLPKGPQNTIHDPFQSHQKDLAHLSHIETSTADTMCDARTGRVGSAEKITVMMAKTRRDKNAFIRSIDTQFPSLMTSKSTIVFGERQEEAYPRTMVIEFPSAYIADRTMMSAWGLPSTVAYTFVTGSKISI